MRSEKTAFVILLLAGVIEVTAGGSVAQQQRQDIGASRAVIEPFNSYVTIYDDDNVEPMRPDIFGTHGVVATGNYAATLIGIEEFKKGGNAFDVGVAAAMAVKATTFDIAGWSGVAPLILYSAEEDRVITRIGAGTAPAAATSGELPAHRKGSGALGHRSRRRRRLARRPGSVRHQELRGSRAVHARHRRERLPPAPSPQVLDGPRPGARPAVAV